MPTETHNASALPVLVFDKDGLIGVPLAQRFAKDCVTVLVSRRTPEPVDQLLYVPYKKQIPSIPAAKFSHFYIVYNGDKSQLELLPSFLKKARVDQTEVFFVTSLRDIQESQLLKLLDEYSRLTLLIVGDMFGPPHHWGNPAQAMLLDAAHGTVSVRGTGLDPVYPVASEDVFSILHATFVRKHTGRVLYLLPPHPMTALSFAREIIRKEPLIRLTFSHHTSTKAQEGFTPQRYISVFGQEYKVDPVVPNDAPIVAPVSPPSRKRRLRLPVRIIPQNVTFFVIVAFVLFVSLPLLSVAGGSAFLLRSVDQIKQGEIAKARSSAAAAHRFFALAEKSKPIISAPLGILSMRRFGDQFSEVIESGSDGAVVITSASDAFTKIHKVTSGKSLDPKKEFSDGLHDIKYALARLATMRAEGRIPPAYDSYVRRLDGMSNVFAEMMDVLPNLVGMERKQTYLVLFQNNMELRPSGGFIGSYALLTLNKGKVEDFVIQDVYEGDGQLKEHIEPPFALRRYLGASHWFLRDSNYDVDFPKSAAMVAYFYNLEMGKKVDGVVAVDTSFVRHLLQALGPVKIEEYNETVTADNFFLLTETYAQEDFFPGSTQKKDFLSAVYNTLLLRLTEQEAIPYGALTDAVGKSVRQKHVLFAFPDLTVQRVFSLNGFSSTLPDLQKGEGKKDLFGINEANIGANKTNYYMDRSITHNVILSEDGTASETATISYRNRSKDGSAFGGEYKTYVRLLLPKEAVLEQIQIDGKEMRMVPAVTDPEIFTARSFIPPAGLEVEKYEQGDFAIYGFLTIVPPGAKKTVAVTYSLPVGVEGSYSLHVFKQPGTEADPYLFSLRIPESNKIVAKPSNMRVAGQTGTVISDLSEDRNIAVTLGAK